LNRHRPDCRGVCRFPCHSHLLSFFGNFSLFDSGAAMASPQLASCQDAGPEENSKDEHRSASGHSGSCRPVNQTAH